MNNVVNASDDGKIPEDAVVGVDEIHEKIIQSLREWREHSSVPDDALAYSVAISAIINALVTVSLAANIEHEHVLKTVAKFFYLSGAIEDGDDTAVH